MKSSISAFLTACILGSCGLVPSSTAPSNLDNACSIVEQRPQYLRAFKATERRWGVPVNVQMAVIHQESRFKANAKTPMRYILGIMPRGRQRSAYGYAQAKTGTWDDYVKETGNSWADRDDFDDRNDIGARLSVDFDINEKTDLEFTYQYQVNDDKRPQEEVTFCAQDQFFGCSPFERGPLNVAADT